LPYATLKSKEQIETMRRAGRVVAEVLQILSEAVRPGVSTLDLDLIAREEVARRNATPAFLGYRGYPASLCASINQEIVHGIPRADRVLKEGDIVSLDFGAILDGYFGDSAVTVPVGHVSAKARLLLQTTRESLDLAIHKVRAGKHLGDIGSAVQQHAESHGMSVVRKYVGHGIGQRMHEPPEVPNFGEPHKGALLKPGLVLAIEPMVNLGTWETRELDDGWTVVTADGKLSAHFEHTVAVTDDGPEVLTLP
jgi:methionyl aminopeptidase